MGRMGLYRALALTAALFLTLLVVGGACEEPDEKPCDLNDIRFYVGSFLTASKQTGDTPSAFVCSGFAIGYHTALVDAAVAAKLACPPAGSTFNSLLKNTQQWLYEHQGYWDDSSTGALIVQALREEYACKKAKKSNHQVSSR